VRPSRVTASVAILAALLVGSLALVILELANGAAGAVSPAIARPCEAREPFEGQGLDATVQRVVLEGLDGAACKLGTTREQLVLSLSPASRRDRPWNRHKIEVAVREGLVHAVDAESQQGRIPALLVPLLHRLVRSTPFEKLIQGGISLGSLLGQA
jgi:hypothetical protein